MHGLQREEVEAPFDFCERLFVQNDAIPTVERLLDAVFVPSYSRLKYGANSLQTGWLKLNGRGCDI